MDEWGSNLSQTEIYQGQTFLKKQEVSKGLLAKIKFRGGAILVNDRPQNATYLLDIGDRVTIDIPAEEGSNLNS